MSNPEFHSCCTCGYKWRHGHHGGHSCVERLLEQIKKLKLIINEKNKILVCEGLISIGSVRSEKNEIG